MTRSGWICRRFRTPRFLPCSGLRLAAGRGNAMCRCGWLRALGLPSVRGQVPLVVALAVDAIGTGCGGPLMLSRPHLGRRSRDHDGRSDAHHRERGRACGSGARRCVIDRVGARRVVIAALVLQAVGTHSYLVCPEWCRERDLPSADCSPASPRLSTTIRSTSSQPAISRNSSPISAAISHSRIPGSTFATGPATWILGDPLDVGSRV